MSRSFDGTTDSISVGSPAVLDDLTDFTYMMWIKPDATQLNAVASLIDKGNNGTVRNRFYISNTSPHLVYGRDFTGSYPTWKSPDNSIDLGGDWVNVAVAYDKSSASNNPSMWINGASNIVTELTAPVGSAKSDASTDMRFGTLGASTTVNEYTGLMAYVQIWDRILTNTEVYNAMKEPGSVTSGLIGYWTMIPGTSPEPDTSGQGNDGTLTGTTASTDDPLVPRIYPTYDGYVKYSSECLLIEPGYIDWSGMPWIWASVNSTETWNSPPEVYTSKRRGYAFWSVSNLPAGAVVTKIELGLYQNAFLGGSARDTIIHQQAAQYASYGNAQALFDGLDDGAIYVQGAFNNTGHENLNLIELGSQANTDLMSHPTWFGVGLLIDEAVSVGSQSKTYYSNDSSLGEYNVRPFIVVTYTDAVVIPPVTRPPFTGGGGGGTDGTRRSSRYRVRQDQFENPYKLQKRKKLEEDELRRKLQEAARIKQLSEWEEEELLIFIML